MKLKSTIFLKIRFKTDSIKDPAHVRYLLSSQYNAGREENREIDSNELDAGHLGYMQDRPRSTGLFNKDGHVEAGDVTREVRNRKHGVSWRLVISLREEDALKMGYNSQEKWEELVRRYMAQYSRVLGLKEEHVRWVAAHHREPGHPHCHVLVWLDDAAPTRRGNLSSSEIRNARRALAREIFEPLRAQYAAEKTMARNAMLDETKNIISQLELLEKKTELEMQLVDPIGVRIAPSFPKEDMRQLEKQIAELTSMMPGKGQAKLQYMPQEVKEKVGKIVDWMLSRDEFNETLERYLKAVREMTRVYTRDEEKIKNAEDKAMDDIRRRLGNIIVRAGAERNKQMQVTKRLTKEQVQVKMVFRSAFRALDKERLKAEAKSQLASMQEAQKSEQKAKKRRQLEMGLNEERF